MSQPKDRFQEALRLFDNKEYQKCKEACSKIYEKNPKDERALSLKGLSMYYLNEKEEGKKCINSALKLNMKSSIAWHFYALFLKEDGNYSQALKCYLQANKNDSSNYIVIRDLSYLQLYLRQLNSFVDSSRKAIECRPGLMLNWVTFAFSNSLIGNFQSAISALESVEKMNFGNLKTQEIHEIKVFISLLKNKQKHFVEAMDYLIHFKDSFIDKITLYENIVKNALLCKNYKIAFDYCKKVLLINSENINYYIWYFIIQINDDKFKPEKYDDLLSLTEDNEFINKLYNILISDLKPKNPKSKIIQKLELAFSTGETFKQLFEEYFLKQIEITIPSFFKNVKFIYQLQPYKIKIIEEILTLYLNNIESKNKVTEKLNNSANISWVYFYLSDHYLFLGENEKSLNYINKAIEITKSVVEFYMLKSKIFKHSYMLNLCLLSYDKARNLDFGDRYLNAKYAKINCRLCNVEESLNIMNEFVKDPLIEENVDYFQCLWYEYECGKSYLQKKQIINSHFLFKSILGTFTSIVSDQADFYNFCLRRYMITDLYRTIHYLDTISKNKYVYDTIQKLDYIYNYVDFNKENIEKNLTEEFEEMKKKSSFNKYKFTSVKDLLNDIENDLYGMLKKLQNITENKFAHFACVKYFLKKEKILMALKSLFYLSKYKNNFYYVISLKIFKEYISDKKFPDEYNEKIEEAKKENYSEWENNNKIEYLKEKIYFEKKMGEIIHDEQFINNIIDVEDKNVLRKTKGKIISELITFASLYLDDDGLKKLNEKMKEKMQLIGIDFGEENLTFYEDKKF